MEILIKSLEMGQQRYDSLIFAAGPGSLLEFDLCCQFACFIQKCCKVETIDFVANNDTICSYCKVETIGFGVNNDTI